MSSKEQKHDNKASEKQSPKPATGDFEPLAKQQTNPAAAIQQARLDPRTLTPRDVLQLRRTIGNQAVDQLLAKSVRFNPSRETKTNGPIAIQSVSFDHIQRRVEKPPQNLSARVLPPINLENKYGRFVVEHSLNGPAPGAIGLRYSIKISMTPKYASRNSRIDFVQVVRTGTAGHWNTTPADFGYSGAVDATGRPIRADGTLVFFEKSARTEQTTGTGWRVDQPGYDTPFYSQAHMPLTPDVGKYHLIRKSKPAIIRDDPSIVGPGYQFEAISTAMDMATGKEFGAVEWGFRVGTDGVGADTFIEYTPTLLEGNLNLAGGEGIEATQRQAGRRAAFDRWNTVYAPQKETASGMAPGGVTRVPGMGTHY